MNTQCTTPSLIPRVKGNTVRSFSTHGQQSAAQGSSTTVSRSDIRLIQYFDSSALGLVRRWRLIGYFPIIYNPHRVRRESKVISCILHLLLHLHLHRDSSSMQQPKPKHAQPAYSTVWYFNWNGVRWSHSGLV